MGAADQTAFSVYQVAMRAGPHITPDMIRRRMKHDPDLASLFLKLGRIYVAPAANLDRILQRLAEAGA